MSIIDTIRGWFLRETTTVYRDFTHRISDVLGQFEDMAAELEEAIEEGQSRIVKRVGKITEKEQELDNLRQTISKLNDADQAVITQASGAVQNLKKLVGQS